MVPQELKYTRDHEWIRIEGDRVIMGVTDFAQHELGDVVFVDLPAAGEKIEAGAAMATVESVKAVSDVYAPIGGEILAVNDDLEHSPEFVNQDPYGKGWIAVIEPGDSGQLAGLLSAKDYEALTAKS